MSIIPPIPGFYAFPVPLSNVGIGSVVRYAEYVRLDYYVRFSCGS